jgi:biopolymer transport protein ExbB/TolQ/biopolymer transport protein ExbD
MWPILAILIVTISITIERTIVLVNATFASRAFLRGLRPLLQEGRIKEALELCQSINKPMTRIIHAGLQHASRGEHWLLVHMDESAYGELPRIEKRTGYLALLGNVATLSGLLGTITGLIKSFAGVSQEETADKATLLAAGISEAMNCTAFGLLTGILALLSYSILNGLTQSILDEINHMTLKAFRIWKMAQPGYDNPTFKPKPIQSPGPQLKHHVGLGGGASHGKKGVFASLQLTPMIDMFIVVLIFLLMTFSASGEILFVNKDIKLPFAEKVRKLDRAPVVAISYPEDDPTGGIIALDGSEVSTALELLEDDSPDWKIAKLTEQLEVKKHNWKLTNPDRQFPGEVIIQSDQNVDFKIIKKIMYSCGLAGYNNVHFAVTEKVAEGAAGAKHEEG